MSQAPSIESSGRDEERPELASVLREAVDALTRLDATRLELLAACCQELTDRVTPEETYAATKEYALFSSLLEETRRNANLLKMLHEKAISGDGTL